MRRRCDYHYDLPPSQIAQTPADERDHSRLLVVGRSSRRDAGFTEVVDLLPANAVVVVNDTRVIPARLHAVKTTGGAVELLLVEPAAPGRGPRWQCMAKASKPIRADSELAIIDRAGTPRGTVRVVSERDGRGHVVVEFRADADADALIDECGELPLPPYIERSAGTQPADLERYQTVYARERGAIAAPTAGLHFTPELLERLEERGLTIARLTLHVGPGTFAPVRADNIDEHVLHSERYEISAATAELVGSGRPVVAVGTTVVRALEASAAVHGRVVAGRAATDIFIRPGYPFRVVDHLITNFHLPESTLMMLVCAFAGYERTLAAYRHAVDAGYRFYSYGDAMLLSRTEGP